MAKGLEEPHYSVVASHPEFEIRRYDATIHAQLRGGQEDDIINRRSFQRIAGYIFGSNHQQLRIAMTAPVFMWEEDEASMMSFVMPSEFELEQLPSPNDSAIQLTEREGEIVAALTFSGMNRMSRVKQFTAHLQALLHEQGYVAAGAPKLAVYDPPMTMPFMRRNEILIPIHPPEVRQ